MVRPAEPDGTHIIIDGEHRWRVSIAYGYESVPIVILDTDHAGCIAATVRHNRARGSHGIESMVDLVKRLRGEGMDDKAIETMLGLSSEERIRLETTEEAFLSLQAGKDAMMGA